MTFSEFANLLFPIFADGRKEEEFTLDLLFSIISFSNGEEAHEDAISINNIAPSTLRAYFNGGRPLRKLAQKINKYIDIFKFPESFFIDASDDAIEKLCDIIRPYCGDVYQGDVKLKTAELFQSVLANEAATKKKSRGSQQKNCNKKEPRTDANNAKTSSSAYIISTPVAPVSAGNYVPRSDIEDEIRESILSNKVTLIRGMSGAGKSELARKVMTDRSGFSIIIQLKLGTDGAGHFDKLLDSDVSVAGVPDGKDPLPIKKNLLRTAGSECLIVVDNFNDVDNESFLEELVGNTGNASILITSQIQRTSLDEIFQNNIKLSAITKLVIDLEDEKHQQAEFAPMVFCKYADLSYYELTDNEQSAATRICDYIADHTMIAAALGCRLKEYGGEIEDILNEMLFSVRECLDQDLVVQVPKDRTYSIKCLTPYEILKRLFRKVLSRTFTEMERQVLGAVILLPTRYRAKHELEELVGDLKEAKCALANSAVRKLIQDGVLKSSLVLYPGVHIDEGILGVLLSQEYLVENGMAKLELNLHPLYAQLFSDSEIKFLDKAGLERQGPIAELSTDFAFHLLNNRFVSTNIPQWHNYLYTYRELCEYMGLAETDKLKDVSVKNKGWSAVWAKEYGSREIADIRAAIYENHVDMNVDQNVSNSEIEDLFCDTYYEDWFDLADMEWILDDVSDKETDILDKNYTPPIKTDSPGFEPCWKPKHPGLFVVAEGPLGSTLWIVDYVTKKEFCVLNLRNQRRRDYRYFKEEYKCRSAKLQDGAMERASLVEFLGGYVPQYLQIPSHIKRFIPIQSIQALGNGNVMQENEIEMVCVPETVECIGQNAFFRTESPRQIIFLGESIAIENNAFNALPATRLERVVLPSSVAKLGCHCFGYQSNLKHIVIPWGTALAIKDPDMGLLALSTQIDGTFFFIMHNCEAEDLYYETNAVISAMNNELLNLPVLYDRSGCVPLDWDRLFDILDNEVMLSVENLKAGIDFTIDERGKIIYSAAIINSDPWKRYSTNHYIFSVPKDCCVYIQNNKQKNFVGAKSEEVDKIYLEDIVAILDNCVGKACDSVNRGDFAEMHNMVGIAKAIINAKSNILPSETVNNILSKIKEICPNTQHN